MDDKVYTWEKIDILPNDQSLVGEVVRRPHWDENDWYKILYIGRKFLFIESNDGGEDKWWIAEKWLIRREVKKIDCLNCGGIGSFPCPPTSCNCCDGTGHLPKVKKKEEKVWAFGWCRFERNWHLSEFPCDSKNTLMRMAPGCGNYIWPAKMNPDGSFTEPDQEE